jgi:hypothetical protein
MVATTGGGLSLQSSIAFTMATGSTTAHVTNSDCVDTLSLIARTATVLTFNEPQTANCQAGTVTFTRQGTSLAYRWLDVARLAQETGTLHKTA